MLILQFPYLTLDLLAPVLVFDFFVRVDEFNLLDLLALDLMDAVNLSQKSLVDTMITEMTMEQDASLLQGLTRPLIENLLVFEIINVLILEEPIPISFAHG